MQSYLVIWVIYTLNDISNISIYNFIYTNVDYNFSSTCFFPLPFFTIENLSTDKCTFPSRKFFTRIELKRKKYKKKEISSANKSELNHDCIIYLNKYLNALEL